MRKTSLIEMAGRSWSRQLRVLGVLALAGTMLSGCGGGAGGGMFGSGNADASSTPSIGDRFSQLFGSKSQAVGAPSAPQPVAVAAEESVEQNCPPVAIRAGASTFAVGLPGKEAAGADLRYQGTIARTARDCSLNAGQITARVGIQGRVIAGPAGAPANVEIPLRVAVAQQGIQEKIIFTKVYRTSVNMVADSSVPFSFVAEDIVYPVPTGNAGDSYVFYIGFDPQGLKPEPRPRGRKH